MPNRKIGRSATSGRFISVAEANRRPATSIIETVHVSSTGVRRRRRRAVRHVIEENQNETGSNFKAGRDL